MSANTARNLLATGALAGIAIGFWLAYPPLGLIIPCGVVLSLLVASRVIEDSQPTGQRKD